MRRVSVILGCASALLCVLIIALWIFSQWHSISITAWECNYYQGGKAQFTAFAFERNRMLIQYPSKDLFLYNQPITRVTRISLGPAIEPQKLGLSGPRWWEKLGFGCVNKLATQGGFLAWIPYWPLAVLTAILPGWQLARWNRRRRRYLDGCCQHCGYDLRASPDRCPECGQPTT